MKIFLVRHGQTTGDVEEKYGGNYDDCLTEEGKKQAIMLAEKVSGKNVKNIFCSSKIRAVETAEIISKKIGVESIIVDNLRERNMFGVLSGLTKSDAQEKFPEEVKRLEAHEYNNFVTNSENYKFFVNRIISSFQRLLDECEHDFLIVTHSGPIRVLFREYFKFGEFKNIGDCALIEIEDKEESFKIISIQGAELK
jgi:alpha-ribazole phosphatase